MAVIYSKASTALGPDMMYAARDTRREGMLIGGTNRKKTVRYQLDVTAQDDVVRQFCFCVASLCHCRTSVSDHYGVMLPCHKHK